MLPEPINKHLHAVDGGGASRYHNLTQKLSLLRTRPTAVSGLFRSRWKRPKNKGPLRVPSHGASGVSGDDTVADKDTGGSKCSEEEKVFFEDLRRVRRGELISKARVDVPRGRGSSAAASISRVLGLLAKKGGVFSATLLRKAARTTRVHAAKNMAGEKTGVIEEEEAQEGGLCRGGGLCERRVLVGRRSKRHGEASELCVLVGEEVDGEETADLFLLSEDH